MVVMLKMTPQELIALNPIIADRSLDEVEDLLDALQEASYAWSPSHSAFINTKMEKVIEVDSLHRFDARSIREWWGNEDFVGEQDQLKFLTNIGCLGILSIPVAIVIAIFWNWQIGLGLAILGILALMISDSRKKNVLTARDKREGRWVDRSKIEWCKNCSHFRKVRKWEDSRDGLWSLGEVPSTNLLPCSISEQTSDVWQDYFDLPREERSLYPKHCPKLKKA